MTTNNSENEHWAGAHPLELLEAYALDALEPEESFQVEAHLDWCGPCSREAARLQESVARLELMAQRTQPPTELQARLMHSLDTGSEDSQEFSFSPPVAASNGSNSLFWKPAVRFLMPVAAMIMVGLFSAAMVHNVRLSDRTDGLEQQNSTLAAQVGLSITENQLEKQLMEDKLNQLQLTSYWLANPANHPLALNTSQSAAGSKGVLLSAKDGSGAIIMVTNMKTHTPGSTYQVYLMRQGNRVWVAEVKVDDQGWGSKAYWPEESLYRFDKIELVSQTVQGAAASSADMVMEANIPGALPSQMLALPAWQ